MTDATSLPERAEQSRPPTAAERLAAFPADVRVLLHARIEQARRYSGRGTWGGDGKFLAALDRAAGDVATFEAAAAEYRRQLGLVKGVA